MFQGRRRDEGRLYFPWERRRAGARASRRWVRVATYAVLVIVPVIALMRIESQRRSEFATRAAIVRVQRAVETFRVDHEGRCPRDFSELLAPGQPLEPYLVRVPSDGWGRAVTFQCPGRIHPESADVTSSISVRVDESSSVE